MKNHLNIYGHHCRDHTFFFHALTFAGSRGSCYSRPHGRVFKRLPRDTASVNAMKQTCDSYSCILHDSSLKSHRKHMNVIKIFVFRMLILVVQNGVGLQNRTSKKSFPLMTLTSTKAQTKCSFRAVMFCRVTSCKQISPVLRLFR